MSYFTSNPFIVGSSSEEQLVTWKTVRKQIETLSDEDAMKLVAEYWSYAPLSNHSPYDLEHPENWPSPWEMISNKEWCTHSIPFGMEFTLRLAGWNEDRFQIISMRDYDISAEITVLKIDNRYALNYTNGQVIDWPDTEQIITNIWSYRNKSYQSQYK